MGYHRDTQFSFTTLILQVSKQGDVQIHTGRYTESESDQGLAKRWQGQRAEEQLSAGPGLEPVAKRQ